MVGQRPDFASPSGQSLGEHSVFTKPARSAFPQASHSTIEQISGHADPYLVNTLSSALFWHQNAQLKLGILLAKSGAGGSVETGRVGTGSVKTGTIETRSSESVGGEAKIGVDKN